MCHVYVRSECPKATEISYIDLKLKVYQRLVCMTLTSSGILSFSIP